MSDYIARIPAHELKTNVGPFEAIRNGKKSWEYRKNDRNFKKGERVILSEYTTPHRLSVEDGFTGNLISARIGYILYGPEYGIADGYCVFQLENVTPL